MLPFIPYENTKFLGINLTKDIQIFYAESGKNIGRNYRDLNQWREMPCYESILEGCQVTAIQSSDSKQFQSESQGVGVFVCVQLILTVIIMTCKSNRYAVHLKLIVLCVSFISIKLDEKSITIKHKLISVLKEKTNKQKLSLGTSKRARLTKEVMV